MNKQNLKYIWQHPFVVAGCNLLLVLIIYSVSRLFFYLITRHSYPDMTASHLFDLMKGGIRFDLTALLYLNSLYLLLELLPLRLREKPTYQKIAKYAYLIPNVIGILVNCIDMVYSQFTDRRTTITFFTEFQNDGNLLTIFMAGVVQYWYVSLFAIFCCVALIVFMRKKVLIYNNGSSTNLNIIFYSTETIILLLSVYFIVIGIRGGFGMYTRPITISNALQYTNHPNETNIVLNTPFCLMRSTESETFPRYDYFTDEQAAAIMSPIHQPNNLTTPNNKNVVVIILESFSKEYWGYFNHDLDNGTYTGYTPFLDSLASVSVTYNLSLASGRKSIDAMPSVLSSIPMIITPYILTPYSTNDVSSIASCLKEIGYQTAFFHGAPNGSMGFLAYSRSAGFDNYYGKDEYNNDADFDGVWAIWDEEFLQYFAQTMSTMQEPFMTSVFTASSHHPFQVPARYEGVFPKGTIPLHQCIGYSDNAMRQFFKYASTQPWYNNTLFVITADHTNMLTHIEYTNDKGLFEVPILFFDPSMNDSLRTMVHNEPVSQTDIMPSVLEYLNYNKPYFAFGRNILTENKDIRYAINYNNPLYQIFSDSLLVQFDGTDIKAIYNFKQDRLLKHNLATELQDYEEVGDMVEYLKAYLYQYTNRLIDNRMIIGK